MVVRQRWGSAVLFAVLLHIVVFVLAGVLLPEEDASFVMDEELTWLDVRMDAAESKVPMPDSPAKEPPPEEAVPSEELLPSPISERAAKEPPMKPEKTADEAGKTEPPPQKKRDYPQMRKPNKPAVLHEETKHGLTEKETAYRGHVEFFADISEEGRVTDLQAWQFEPEIADEKERRLLEERLSRRIKERWRYAPSLTPEGVPTTQTKREEMDLPTMPPVKNLG